MKIAVVGAGVSGLAAAHRLTEIAPEAELFVLEASERVGGALRTERVDGCVIERGPDSILTDKPWAVALAKRLGLGRDIVSTRADSAGAYVVCRGRLVRIPRGFSLMAPLEAGSFLRSPVLSWRGKARAGLDLVLPRGPATEQSLSSLVRRRFGDELLDRLAQPLAAGIYGADPARLSLDATLPRFVQAERDARSVVVGLRRRQAQLADARTGSDPGTTAGVRYGMFVSFATGMERLIEALAATLGPHITTGRPVMAIEPCERGFRVFDGIGQLEVDGVVLAVPPRVAAMLLRPHLPRASALLDGIELGSTATVTLLLDRVAIPHSLDAYGFVVPVVERRTALAATWVSRKWPDRAPADKELIRVFFGGAARPEVPRWSDDDLIAAARRELRELLGVTAHPALVRVDRWLDVMPQYAIGHRARATAIADAVAGLGPLRLGGTALWGVGIPDAVREGESAAEEVVATLGSR